MSTREHSVDSWPCPCGEGELQFHTSTPDHPWSPKTSLDAVVWTCARCEQKFEYEVEPQFGGSTLAGSPSYSGDKERILYSRKADHEPVRLARRRVDQAKRAVSLMHQELENDALASLEGVAGPARHRLAALILGFPNAEQAKSFIARRHVATFVAEAMRDADRRERAARYYNRLDEMKAAEGALAVAKAEASSLGRVPMHSFRERESTMAMISRALK